MPQAKDTGFTLVEVMIALVLLSIVLLGLGASVGSVARTASEGGQRTTAIQLAEDRLDRVQIDPNYDSLEAQYAGTEAGLPGLPDFWRRTAIVHEGGPGEETNHKVVTVSVTGPGQDTVTRTGTVAAP